jgi:hypothetical protein
METDQKKCLLHANLNHCPPASSRAKLTAHLEFTKRKHYVSASSYGLHKSEKSRARHRPLLLPSLPPHAASTHLRPRAPSRRRRHQENLGRRGKGEEARGLTGDQSPEEYLDAAVVICAFFPHRRRLSPPPSPPSPPLPRLVSPFHEPIHGVDLVVEKTGG